MKYKKYTFGFDGQKIENIGDKNRKIKKNSDRLKKTF